MFTCPVFHVRQRDWRSRVSDLLGSVFSFRKSPMWMYYKVAIQNGERGLGLTWGKKRLSGRNIKGRKGCSRHEKGGFGGTDSSWFTSSLESRSTPFRLKTKPGIFSNGQRKYEILSSYTSTLAHINKFSRCLQYGQSCPGLAGEC